MQVSRFVCVVIATTVTLFLTSERSLRAVSAQDDQQCSEYPFDTPFIPGSSCEDIYIRNAQTREKPGYYWILKLDGPSRVYCGMNYTGISCEDIYINHPITEDKPGYYRINNNQWVYCNMTDIAFSRGDLISSCVGVGGTWKRVASFNITAGDNCPSPWMKSSHNGVAFCRNPNNAGGCYSVISSTNGRHYEKVCGKASGHQKGSPDAFVGITSSFDYFEGLSITHGSPRQHIWTYAAGLTDSGNSGSNCPCAVIGGQNPPLFVGSQYYCESGAGTSWSGNQYYLSDILWDGAGCSASNSCCSDPNLPWFYRQLDHTTKDDIEARLCTDQSFDDEAVLITGLELYVQ